MLNSYRNGRHRQWKLKAPKYFGGSWQNASSVTEHEFELIEQLERAVQIERLQNERRELIDNEKSPGRWRLHKLEVLDPSVTFESRKNSSVQQLMWRIRSTYYAPNDHASFKLRRLSKPRFTVESGGRPERFGARVSEKFSLLKQRYAELVVKRPESQIRW